MKAGTGDWMERQCGSEAQSTDSGFRLSGFEPCSNRELARSLIHLYFSCLVDGNGIMNNTTDYCEEPVGSSV